MHRVFHEAYFSWEWSRTWANIWTMARYWLRKCWLAWGNAMPTIQQHRCPGFHALATLTRTDTASETKTNSCACRPQYRDTACSYKPRAWKTSSRTKFLVGHLQGSTCISSKLIGFLEQLKQLATSSLLRVSKFLSRLHPWCSRVTLMY